MMKWSDPEFMSKDVHISNMLFSAVYFAPT